MQVGYVTDTIFLKHDTGVGHPESSDRLRAIASAIEAVKHTLVTVIPQPAAIDEIERIHTVKQIAAVEACSAQGGAIDSDTICSQDTYLAARTAVGAGFAAIDGIRLGKFNRAFCAVRPPGHHATPERAMGFCFFNNIAISARYAQKQGYEKVMIIDFDVHHGNGTQEAFYADDTVFYFSSHQAFSYPGTGMESETGVGKGKGHTRNFLIMPDSGDVEVRDIYQNDLPPFVTAFNPDIILVSAGYDLHESDPLAQLNVTTEGIRSIIRAILGTADVPFVFFLEGGYDVEALGQNVRVTIEELMKD